MAYISTGHMNDSDFEALLTAAETTAAVAGGGTVRAGSSKKRAAQSNGAKHGPKSRKRSRAKSKGQNRNKPTRRMFPTNRNLIRKETAEFRQILGRRSFLARNMTPLSAQRTAKPPSSSVPNPALHSPVPLPLLVVTQIVLKDDADDRVGTTQTEGQPLCWNTSTYVTSVSACPLCYVHCQDVSFLIRHLRSHRQHPYYICDVDRVEHGTGEPYGTVYHLVVRPIDIRLSDVFYADHTFARDLPRMRPCCRRRSTGLAEYLAKHGNGRKADTETNEVLGPSAESSQTTTGKTQSQFRPIRPAIQKIRIQPLSLDRKECLAPSLSMGSGEQPKPIRKYYHRRSNRPKLYVSFVDDSSDDDSDQEPMDALCNGMLTEFEDVSNAERRFFILWGMFIRRQQLPFRLQDMLTEKIRMFVYEYHAQLKGLRWIFLKHVQNLCLMPHGLTGQQLLECMRLFDEVVKPTVESEMGGRVRTDESVG